MSLFMQFPPCVLLFEQLAAHLPLLPFKDSPQTSPLDEASFAISSFPIELTTVSSLNPADRHCHILAILPNIDLCI